jgi:basic membrane protein A and related proteins
MMKKIRLGAVLAAAGLLFAACGDDSTTTSSDGATTTPGVTETTVATSDSAAPSGDCADAAVYCVGLVTDVGKVDDKSFNQSAWEGAQEGAAAIGGKAEFIETKDSKDYAANIQQFLDQKYDVVLTVGFAIGEATGIAAKANPTVKFIGVDQFQAAEVANVTGLIFAEDKAGFMAGALAGLLTKTNSVASVLGTDKVPPVVAFGKGFENGAKFSNPKVKTSTTYHPGGLDVAFLDPAFGAATAKQALDNGADIIFGAGGKTGNGALEEVAKKAGALCIGVDSDQWETVPGAHPCLVTSAMKLIVPGVVKLLGQVKDGSIKGGNFVGDVGLADYHDLASVVPADVQAKMKTIIADVLSGKQATGYTPG